MRVKNHLSAAQRRELEAELRAEASRLRRSMARTQFIEAGAIPITESNAVAGGDIAAGLGLVLETRSEAASDTITRALQRLADGTYGHCVRCDDPIPYGRLLALPETEHCLTCGMLG